MLLEVLLAVLDVGKLCRVAPLRPGDRLQVYVMPEVAEEQIAAAVAAGVAVADDSDAPSLTMVAHQYGNKGVECVDVSAARKS